MKNAISPHLETSTQKQATPGYSNTVIELSIVTRHINTFILRWASSPFSPNRQRDCFLFLWQGCLVHLRERERERDREGERERERERGRERERVRERARERAREREKRRGWSGDTSLSPIILAACSFSNKKKSFGWHVNPGDGWAWRCHLSPSVTLMSLSGDANGEHKSVVSVALG